MTQEQPFVKQHLDEEGKKLDTFTIRLNEEERGLLNSSKKIIEQVKDSTALKSLAWIGAKVIHEKKMSYILGLVIGNKKRNKRLNIVDFD